MKEETGTAETGCGFATGSPVWPHQRHQKTDPRHLADHCWRALYHRGAERGKRVVMFHGGRISRTTAREWQLKHPLTVNLPEALKGTKP
jgi:cytolysin-activating lysine-acyltransferase